MKKYMVIFAVILSLSFIGCKNEDMTGSMQSEEKSNDSNKEEILGTKKPDNGGNSGNNEEIKDGELVYIIEPKANYDPENKIPTRALSGDIYGYTQNEKDYISNDELLVEENKLNQKAQSTVSDNQPIKKENIYDIGDKIFLNKEKCYFAVNGYKIYDNVSEFNRDDFFDVELYDKIVDSKGNIKPQKKIVRWFENGEENEEISDVNVKFVTFDCTLEGDSDWVQRMSISNIKLYLIDNDNDYYNMHEKVYGKEHNKENLSIRYTPGVSGGYEGDYIYFDKAICREDAVRSSFFFTYITKGETINFKIGAFVDEEMLDKMCLFYHSSLDSFIYTDSVIQKGIKLFD